MCGTGLNLIPFLEAGADIDGVDSSPHMLSVCRQKLETQNLTSNLYEQSLQFMALPRQYAFAFIPDGSFGHFYDLKTAQECLQSLYKHLLDGGWLLFDVKSTTQLGNFPKAGESTLRIRDRADGSTILETTVWGKVEADCIIRCWSKIESYVDQKLVETEVFDYRERLYRRQEMETMLSATGFKVEAVFKPYQHCDPQEGDGLVFVCRK
jgi:SAM-dependent methyltransferase